jgi:hypothetical protein
MELNDHICKQFTFYGNLVPYIVIRLVIIWSRKMYLNSPDLEICEEIIDINRTFLQLLTHPATHGAHGILGLDGGALAGLNQLTAAELELLAQAPLLLVEFSPFPGFAEIRDAPERRAQNSSLGQDWRAELQGFANRLLTCVWQTARRDKLMTSLCVGIDQQYCRTLSGLSFCRISQCAEEAADSLRVRLAQHPRFWADLIRLAHHGSVSQQVASRMSLIQLSVAQQWTGKSVVSNPRYL